MKGRGREGGKGKGEEAVQEGRGAEGEGTVWEGMEGTKEKRRKVEGMGRGERRGGEEGRKKNSHLMISPRNPKIPEILNINQ